MKPYLERLFSYNAWANRRMIEKLQSLKNENKQVLPLFSHLLATENLWLSRILGFDTSDFDVWPDYTLEKCDDMTAKNRINQAEYLDTLTESELKMKVTYKSLDDFEYHHTLSDILTHLVIHSSYHRAQIARELRKLNVDPVNTDFITFLRDGG